MNFDHAQLISELDQEDIFTDIDPELNHFSQLYPELSSTYKSDYYDIPKFNTIFSNNSKDLSLIHINIRSLFHKIDHLQALFDQLIVNFDVICFTESWLNDSNKNLVNMSGYLGFHSLRINRMGGGISMYVRDKFKIKIIHNCTVSNFNLETLFLSLIIDSQHFTIATVYKPPQVDFPIFIEAWNFLINTLTSNQSRDLIICGDFNIDLFSNLSEPFQDAIFSQSFIPIINKPTRITDTSATLIDNILINNPSNFTSGILLYDISDHLPIFIIRKHILMNNSNPNTFVKLNFREINLRTIDCMCAELQSRLSELDFNTNDVNISLNSLENLIFELYYRFCPIKTKTISIKQYSKPWITREILHNVKKRQAYFILFKQNKVDRNFYFNYRNFVTNLIRISKKQYFEYKFHQFKNNSRKMWEIINNVIGNRAFKDKKISNLKVGQELITDNKLIADNFNHFFVNIGPNISRNVTGNVSTDHRNYLDNNYLHSCYLNPTYPAEVFNIINSFKNKTTSNTSIIPIQILKSISHIIDLPLSIIINKSFISGIFPDNLKLSRVIPIFKSGEKDDMNNYRPISLLPNFSKIFEKIIYRRMLNYIERNNILNSCQYGFRKNLSTSHALLDQFQYLYDSLDDGNFVFSVFLDFRKAFDSLDHNILFSKLQHYGFRGTVLSLIKSYLSDRKQYSFVNGVSSGYCNITHGVPQGSNLGPLLFLIFINDLLNSSSLFKFILFADDSTLSTCIPKKAIDIPQYVDIINNELDEVNKWILSNKICINTDKTKYILFSYRSSADLPPICIGRSAIERSASLKFLGVMIDEHLTFKNHVQYISKKISRSVGILNKLKFYLPIEPLKSIYSAFVLPYLNYAIEIWYAGYKNVTQRIFILQKKAIRAVNNLDFNSHTSNSFLEMKTLKVEDLHKFKISMIMYFAANNEGYDFLSKRLIINNHIYSTRNSNLFILPRYRLAKSQRSALYFGMKLSNNLLNHHFQLSLSMYKNLIKCHFLSQYSN